MADSTSDIIVRRLAEITCDISTSVVSSVLIAFEESPDISASVLQLTDLRTHYHKRSTELYYILDGEGILTVEGVDTPITPGTCVLVRPLRRHRVSGDIQALVVCTPAMHPADLFYD